MAAQRGANLPASKDDSKPAAKERKRPAAPRRKLTFSDKHALEALPAKIETLEKAIASLQKELSGGNLYARDPARFRDLSAKLSAAESERAACEDRWLELELLKEEVEGSR
jgi:ATP-binding cassette subfamily F protein uup